MMSRIRLEGLASGLIGVLAGALLMASLPALAGDGDPLILGEKSTAKVVTRLNTRGGLRVDNLRSGNPALILNVVGATPPMAVNSTGLVDNLNADLLDSRTAGDLLRVGFASTQDAADADGAAVTATVVAPTNGYLVISGTIDAYGANGGYFQCRLEVDSLEVPGTRMYAVVHTSALGAADHTINSEEDCSTTGALQVTAGSHDVAFVLAETDASVSFRNASVWALFVPFDGNGLSPSADGQPASRE